MKRLYGLFERERGTRKWTRMYPELAFTKATAVRAFQDHLLAPYFRDIHNPSVSNKERSLRPVTKGIL